MDRLIHKKQSGQRRALRVRAKVVGRADRPRLAVHISNLHVTAQIIDDGLSKTLVHSSSAGHQIDGTLSAKASWVGGDIAKKAKKAKLSKVTLDRSTRKYHGRIKALAEAARAEGLEF
jgi:large subunit ribosomal protein L18